MAFAQCKECSKCGKWIGVLAGGVPCVEGKHTYVTVYGAQAERHFAPVATASATPAATTTVDNRRCRECGGRAADTSLFCPMSDDGEGYHRF